MAFDIFPWGPMKRKTGTRDVRQNLMDMKDCGFTASCFIEPKDIPVCREVGLNPITFLFDTPDSFEVPENQWEFNMSTEGLPNITRLVQDKTATPEIIEKAMEQALSQVPEGPARVYIVDEPGASWMPRSNQMVEYVRKHRPELTPYINLFPNYAVCGAPDLSQLETDTFEEYLDAFCRIVPGMPISIDNYIVLASKEFRTPGGETIFYQNYIQVREACDKYGVEFHHIICSNQLRNYQPIPTFNNLLLQAMTSLAAGARSIAWYTYFGRAGYLWAPVDDNTDEDVRTPTWYLVREVNRRIQSLGSELSAMRYEGLYFTHPGDLKRAKNISECAPITRFVSDERCVIGLYRDGDEPVVFVVNGSLDHSTRIEAEIQGETPRVWSVEQGKYRAPILKTPYADPSPMWLAPGEAVILRR